MEWLELHCNEFREDWLLARQRKPPMKIPPLELGVDTRTSAGKVSPGLQDPVDV